MSRHRGSAVGDAAAALAAPIFDPRTYAEGVPYGLFARLRREAPVLRMEEPAVLGWPAGPGFWAVLRHADVKAVLRDAKAFSSHLGGTQIRDPDTPEDLAYVRRMMLNIDPPEHCRLRGLLAKAFTPKAVAQLEARVRTRAAALVGGQLVGVAVQVGHAGAASRGG